MYPYPLSAAVSLSVISRSFLAVVPVLPGNAEVLDEVNHKGGYSHCYKRIYDTSCGDIRQGQYQHGYVRQQVCPGYAAARNLGDDQGQGVVPGAGSSLADHQAASGTDEASAARAARRG